LVTSLSTSLVDMQKVVETEQRKNEMRKMEILLIRFINLVFLL